MSLSFAKQHGNNVGLQFTSQRTYAFAIWIYASIRFRKTDIILKCLNRLCEVIARNTIDFPTVKSEFPQVFLHRPNVGFAINPSATD